MARRFGGKYSPSGRHGSPGRAGSPERDGSPPGARRPARPLQANRIEGVRWANFLFFTPLPLALRAFAAPPREMGLMLIAFATLILAAWLTREGAVAEAAYDARRIARRPAFPRKLAGTALIGAGLFLAALAGGQGAGAGLILAALGMALHFLAFGPDPLKDKGLAGIDGFQTERVARAVEGAEKYLAEMEQAAGRTHDRAVTDRLARFTAQARDLIRAVEEDPRDLSAARRFLGVYLMGARDATVKFADLYGRSRDAAARAGWFALLDELEQNFAAKTRALMENDSADLEIEIEVLRERLAREGLKT